MMMMMVVTAMNADDSLHLSVFMDLCCSLSNVKGLWCLVLHSSTSEPHAQYKLCYPQMSYFSGSIS